MCNHHGFRGGWRPQAESYPLIHGVVSDNPYGGFVTLINGFTKQTKLSSAGIGSESCCRSSNGRPRERWRAAGGRT